MKGVSTDRSPPCTLESNPNGGPLRLWRTTSELALKQPGSSGVSSPIPVSN